MSDTNLEDLGWDNYGGETSRRIANIVKVCDEFKHKRIETNEGVYGTQHSVSCPICAFIYHYDSSD